MRAIILGMLMLGMTACSSGGGGEAATTSKALFSSWTADSTGIVLDLSLAHYGSNPVSFVYSTGESCGCTLVINQDALVSTEGTYTVSSCAYISGGSGNPGTCTSFNESGAWYNSGGSLRLDDGTSTVTFH